MTTGYATTKAAILAHAVAAGAALTPAITDVAAAFPLPGGRCIRVYYGGEAEPAHIGRRVLNAELVGKVTYIAAFWPVTTLSTDVAAAIDADMETLSHEMRTRINGDSQLGGATTDLSLDYGEPDIAIFNGARYAVLLWRVVGDFTEYSISP